MPTLLIVIGGSGIVLGLVILISNIGNIRKRQRARSETVALIPITLGTLFFVIGWVLKLVESYPQLLK